MPISGKLSRCFDRIDFPFGRRSESCIFDSDDVGGADVMEVDDIPILLDWDRLSECFSTNDADDIALQNFLQI